MKWQEIGMTELEMKGEFDGYYIYAHIKNSEVLYIGKGCKRRAISSFIRRPYYDEYKKGNIEVVILARFGCEQEALRRERELINYYKMMGMARYNDVRYHQGRKRDVQEVAIVTDVENISLNQLELNVIRNPTYRMNMVIYVNSLQKMDKQELESQLFFIEQLLSRREDEIEGDLIRSYQIIKKHIKKILKRY